MTVVAAREQQLTRRQIREQARALEAAAARRAAGGTPQLVADTPEAEETQPRIVVAPQNAPAPLPMTRRERRLALQAAEAEGLATPEISDEAAGIAAGVVLADPVMPAATAESTAAPVSAADFTDTESLTLPTRRELKAAMTPEKRRRAAEKKPSGITAPRAAILTTLGMATIAAPLTGFVSPQHSAQAIGSQVPVQTSVSDLVAAAVASSELEGSISSADKLTSNPSAFALAQDLSARSQDRNAISECRPVEGASGVREASVERVSAIYRPMVPGTYRDTSPFGPRWGSMHTGTDMAAPVGTPMYAVTDGTVVHSGEGIEGRSGHLIIVESVIDGEKVWFWYGHMYSQNVYVSEGETVTAGQMLAGVGNAGFSTGPHLHFEVHAGTWDNAIDPLSWLSQAGAVSPGSC